MGQFYHKVFTNRENSSTFVTLMYIKSANDCAYLSWPLKIIYNRACLKKILLVLYLEKFSKPYDEKYELTLLYFKKYNIFELKI